MLVVSRLPSVISDPLAACIDHSLAADSHGHTTQPYCSWSRLAGLCASPPTAHPHASVVHRPPLWPHPRRHHLPVADFAPCTSSTLESALYAPFMLTSSLSAHLLPTSLLRPRPPRLAPGHLPPIPLPPHPTASHSILRKVSHPSTRLSPSSEAIQ